MHHTLVIAFFDVTMSFYSIYTYCIKIFHAVESTKLFVGNLRAKKTPENEEKLRQHFERVGDVVDCALMGKFAFVVSFSLKLIISMLLMHVLLYKCFHM